MVEHEALAHGFAIRKELPRRPRINHCHPRSLLTVQIGKLAAFQKAYAESADVSRADDMYIRMRKAPWLWQRHALYRNVGAPMVVGQRDTGSQRRGLDARQRPQ